MRHGDFGERRGHNLYPCLLLNFAGQAAEQFHFIDTGLKHLHVLLRHSAYYEDGVLLLLAVVVLAKGGKAVAIEFAAI